MKKKSFHYISQHLCNQQISSERVYPENINFGFSSKGGKGGFQLNFFPWSPPHRDSKILNCFSRSSTFKLFELHRLWRFYVTQEVSFFAITLPHSFKWKGKSGGKISVEEKNKRFSRKRKIFLDFPPNKGWGGTEC